MIHKNFDYCYSVAIGATAKADAPATPLSKDILIRIIINKHQHVPIAIQLTQFTSM